MISWNNIDWPEFGFDWAIEASNRMKKFILNNEHQQLIDYESQGRNFKLAIPTPEHYLPLLYMLALKNEEDKIMLFNDKPFAGSITMTSLKIS